jgi:diguanylate cyclase (GGDEF)-like protein/PAS domain S-box-containing protein
VVQNISAGIVVLDPAERVVEVNPYAATLIGRRPGSTVGQPIASVLQGWPDLGIEELAEKEVLVGEGEAARWFHSQSALIRAENGEPAGYVVALFDVTARKEAERRLEDLARLDPLTGVANRRYFRERAEEELARAERYARPVAVLLLDVDHFKKVNDSYGHQIGDEVLKRVAAECQRNLRGTDVFGRYGGEEFICLLAESGPEDARRAAERMREAVADARWSLADRTVTATISVGLACRPSGAAETLDRLAQKADEALYAAKAAGRNRVMVWEAAAEG